MVGAYSSGTVSTGAGRGALLPAPAKQPPRSAPRQTNGKEPEGPAVTVFIGKLFITLVLESQLGESLLCTGST